jgi:hypothetical protein
VYNEQVEGSALKIEDYFPAELPRFDLPPFPLEARGPIGAVLANFTKYSQQYISEREAMVVALQESMRGLVEIAEKFSLSGGPPNLEELIAVAGDHLEKVEAQIQPQLAQMRESRRRVARSQNMQVRAVMTGLADRNIGLMKGYVEVARNTYERLIALRDESIRRSYEALADEVLAGWDEEP